MIYDLSKLSPELRAQIENSTRWRKLFSGKPKNMLRLDGNAKTIKGNKKGFKTAILYLTPANGSGVNLCAMALIAACVKPCLNTSGRGAFDSTQMARLRKTLFLLQYEAEAIAMIKRDIAKFAAQCEHEGFTLLVRLNGTSDIRWELYDIIQSFPNIQFYDYTKLPNRRNVPSNYDLTFSYSGLEAFRPFVEIAKRDGNRIAVVFRNRRMVESLLANGGTFQGLPVVDGDDTDIRHLDPRATIVALYAKGKAKRDNSGFVVDV
jgi:hypothetical protein